MDQFARLVHQGGGNIRRPMPQHGDGDSRAQVKIAPPLHIPHFRTFAPLQYQVKARVGRHDVFLKPFLDARSFVSDRRA